jgi:uncharacterized membrane protein
MQETGRLAALLDQLPWWTVPALLGAIVGTAAVLVLALRGFAQGVVWRYYWGPIKADALGAGPAVPFYDCPDGLHPCANAVAAHSGFNPVNTASWALLLVLVAFVGLVQVARRTRTPADDRAVAAISAGIVTGSVFHVVEDTGLFPVPLRYLFITPALYLLFFLHGLLYFWVGRRLMGVASRRGKQGHREVLVELWAWMVLPALACAMWLGATPQPRGAPSPVLVVACALVGYGVAWLRVRRAGVSAVELVAIANIAPTLVGAAILADFAASPWRPAAPEPGVLWTLPLAALLAVAAWALGRWRLRRAPGSPWGQAAARPMNAGMLLAQLVDGLGTAVGIDLHGYGEKHVLSRGLIEGAKGLGRTLHLSLLERFPATFAFVPLKVAITVLVVAFLEVMGRWRTEGTRLVVAAARFSVVMVGLGPGLRDVLRIAVGV